MLVEVCANSLQSALNAQKGGADRIELCSELGIGGVTPSYGMIKSVKQHIEIPVHVLIRPRSGDFTYSDYEFETMKTDIALCTEMGFDGIVSGVLHSDFTLDVARTKILIDLSDHLNFTFHRAFDWVKNPLDTLEQLEDLGVDCVLTSGQQKSALEGMPLLNELREKASSCTIMPGGGINNINARRFKEAGFKAIHLSGTKFHKTLSVPPSISMNTPSFLEEDKITLSDPEIIQQVVKSVK